MSKIRATSTTAPTRRATSSDDDGGGSSGRNDTTMVSAVGTILKTVLVTDMRAFRRDMAMHLPRPSLMFARLYRFPQVLGGTFSMIMMSPTCIGAYYLYARMIANIMGGQIHKRRPFSKWMGLMMNIPMSFVLPLAIQWLIPQTRQRQQGHEECRLMKVQAHYWFVLYSTVMTSISCLMDVPVLWKWMTGRDVGTYRTINRGGGGNDSNNLLRSDDDKPDSTTISQ